MTRTMPRKLIAALMLGATLAAAGVAAQAQAQDYPSQPIRMIVPYPPGGGNDALGRITAEYLSRRLGQPVVVENKPGAGSAIGIDLVAKAKPDGYTILWTASDGISLLPAVKQGLPYRVPEDFSFIATATDWSNIVAVNPKLPVKNFAEFVTYAKANPGKLRYGTAGVGGAPHMATALLAKTAGIEMVHVPYQGTGPALTAVVGGHIDLTLSSPGPLKPLLDNGSLRAIVIADQKRHPLYPDVPTTAEAGFPGLLVKFWAGLMAPAGVPEQILAKLRGEMEGMLKDPQIVERFDKLGYLPVFMQGDAFKNFVVNDLNVWRETAKSANIVID